MPVNIRDGELNENDMTHDKLYSRNTYTDIYSQKKTHTPKNIPNKQKMKQQRQRQPQGVIVWCVRIKL